MAKYKIKIIYTTSKWTEIEVEASSGNDARMKAELCFMEQDLEWQDTNDADLDVDVEKVED
jgi:hypothetical protein